MPAKGTSSPLSIRAEALGSGAFRNAYGTRFAYYAGAMAKGIASTQMVTRLAKARLMSFYGSGGQTLDEVEAAIHFLRANLAPNEPFGINFLHNLLLPEVEEQTVELFLTHKVDTIEAAAFIKMTPALVRYRVSGLCRLTSGEVVAANRVLAKASRPEVARLFLAPPPQAILEALLCSRAITQQEFRLAPHIAMADDLCAEADSGGHTDRRPAQTLIPAFLRLRDEAQALHRFVRPTRVGAGGGIGTPEAVAAAFIMGVDFVMTGSVNQCTVEAGTSELAKDLLAAADIQDVEMAPASDMFEIGGKVQVLRKGVLFAGRAARLYELYRRHDSLDQIDSATLRMIEDKYLHRSFESVWNETREYYSKTAPGYLAGAEQNPKQKMALLFRWYLIHSNRLALKGDQDHRVDFQIHCGPAMGAFNQFVRGTPLEDWRNRHVDEIAELLMRGAATMLEQRLREYTNVPQECT